MEIQKVVNVSLSVKDIKDIIMEFLLTNDISVNHSDINFNIQDVSDLDDPSGMNWVLKSVTCVGKEIKNSK